MSDTNRVVFINDVDFFVHFAVADEIERLREELDDWRNREAACCPEDTPFEDVISKLRDRIWDILNEEFEKVPHHHREDRRRG
jgi:hypothetical protein